MPRCAPGGKDAGPAKAPVCQQARPVPEGACAGGAPCAGQGGGKQKMMDSVIAYLHQHYTDACFSLRMAADHFNVSESYLSYVFKEQSGTNFFAFVEALRIEKAKSLLKETDLKINEIAEQIGYASANSFCRAFKRATGDSATGYRSEDQKEEEN